MLALKAGYEVPGAQGCTGFVGGGLSNSGVVGDGQETCIARLRQSNAGRRGGLVEHIVEGLRLVDGKPWPKSSRSYLQR